MKNWQYHYKVAERLMDSAGELMNNGQASHTLMEAALVHATLASIKCECPPEPLKNDD